MLTRSEAREHLMTVLFALALRRELNSVSFDQEINYGKAERKAEVNGNHQANPEIQDPYLISTGQNVIEHLEVIDSQIEKYLQGWRVERLATVDLTIMRIAVAEMLYDEEIPNGVSINEAIELAKKYSEEDAYRFINGILGSISRSIQSM